MPTIPHKRREAYAHFRARGFTSHAAYFAAGFKNNSLNQKKTEARAEVQARIEELREVIEWGETSDVSPVINVLMRIAKRAETSDAPSAMVAVRGLLAEAAKLKGQIKNHIDQRDVAPKKAPLSNADWLAKHAPRG